MQKNNRFFSGVAVPLFIAIFFSFCQTELENNTLVYFNDFESGADEISGAAFINFNGSRVLGNFHQEGFTLHLDDLPEHDYIVVSFDLYLHDSWDGNSLHPDGPDIWGMELDEWIFLTEKTDRKNLFETTFSNSVCFPNYCLQQSFPGELPAINPPKTGASGISLPGLCQWANVAQGTTLYQIEKIFEHSASGMALKFYDLLSQPNALSPKCDESWSMDNLRIRTISIK